MSNLSRRSLVASAAALPALAVPAVATANHLAVETDSRLLALAEELKPLWARLCSLDPQRHATYEKAISAIGGWQDADAHQKFFQAGEETGYSALMDIYSSLEDEVRRIADAILEIPSTDRLGDAIRLAAILMNQHPDNECIYSDLLWEMAAHAGFVRAQCEAVQS